MFDPVSPQVSFAEKDRELLTFWSEQRIFEKTKEHRKSGKPFIFYEGPPTANGMPHPGHVLTRVMKDVFLRYRSMCGYYVPRRAGWDTHGLPVEVEVEKELGIHGREEIEKYGVEAFTQKCIESVFRYTEAWRKMTERIGFWVDLDEAYVTYHKAYVESVWWALSELFRRGLLYQDYKIVWWWPQGGTALSAGEVGQGYKTVDDPSVIVRFPVKGEANTSFLAWTTTPWTLSSNIALAVNAKETYVTAELEAGERVIVAKALAGKLLADKPHSVVSEALGSALVGKEYEPPFRYKTPEGGPAYRVIAADFVSMDTGSGMVHIAPAFGEDDFQACKKEGLGFLQLVDPSGKFVPEVTDFAGRFCKEADRDILKNLRQRGVLFHEEVYRHDYPFCWRAMEDPLIQYARRSWFIRTTQEIDHVIENNQRVHWEPDHIQEGRFGAFLRSNVDWALSRERYWGTPLPIWVNDETGAKEAVSSAEEILKRNPKAFDHFRAAQKADPSLSDHLMVHKPWVDNVTWTKPGEPGVYRRVTEVIDCWFDSGCMPFAQWGYPHTGKAEFEAAFPADFITEAVDQTRGWFYSLMTISTLLFGEPATGEGSKARELPHPFKNCLVLGLITDAKGKKLSKRDRNYADPMGLMDAHGADAVRWALYANTVPGQGTKFHEGAAVDALRDLLLKAWNVYSFFVTYSNIDGWDPKAPRTPVKDRPDIDRWILADLDATVRDVRKEMDVFRSHVAVRRIADFTDALSNWYVRRSRDRFWASGNTPDKVAAFATLYEVLVDYAKLIAPFTPFLAELLYQNLVRKADPAAPESVHLASFPEGIAERVDEQLRGDVNAVRSLVGLGLRVRTEKKLKVRQPLAKAVVVIASDDEERSVRRFEDAVRGELNVHAIEFTREPAKYVEFELVPNFRTLGPKLGKDMPACKAALQKADGSALHGALSEKGSVTIALPAGSVTLSAEDLEVRLSAKGHFAAASEGGRVLVLDTEVTDVLRREGLAREVVNRLQRARKELNLAYEARIDVTYTATGELARAIEEHRGVIESETLARTLRAAEDGAGSGKRYEDEVDGETFVFTVGA